jgi:hypothetical protein
MGQPELSTTYEPQLCTKQNSSGEIKRSISNFESPPPATSMDTGFPQKLLTFFGKVRRRESFEIDMFRICYLQWLKAMVRPAKKPNNASVKT